MAQCCPIRSSPRRVDRTTSLAPLEVIVMLAMAIGMLMTNIARQPSVCVRNRFLTQTLGWRAIFVINIPIAIASITITSRGAREVVRSTRRGLDLIGQHCAILMLAALTYGLIRAE